MTTSPRAALEILIAALERHYEACAVKRGDDDPALERAVERLCDAFEAYDDALFEAFDEVTPLILGTDDEDDDIEFYDDEDDEEYDDLDDVEELDDDAKFVDRG